MRVETKRLDLRLKETFRISRGATETARNLLVKVDDGETVGLGECAPYKRDRKEIAETLGKVELPDSPYRLEAEETRELLSRLPSSARAGVETALNDLAAKKIGSPLWKILGVGKTAPPTSYTVGISSLEETQRLAEKAASEQFAVKLKLGGEKDEERLEAVREVIEKTEKETSLRVDVNGGWSLDEALEKVSEVKEAGVELVEQPTAGLEDLGRVADSTSVPVYADEGIETPEDVAEAAEYVNGVVLKLVKAGGVRELLREIHVARAHGLGVMVGCMVESRLGIAAAAHVAPLADYIDLDGSLLIEAEDDPFVGGVEFRDDCLLLPDSEGVGVAVEDTEAT